MTLLKDEKSDEFNGIFDEISSSALPRV